MKNKKRIVLVFTRYNPPYFTGGIERYINNLNEYLLEKGYDVVVIVIDDGKKYIDEYNNIVKIKVPNIRSISTLIFSYKLRKIVKEDDIVNIHFPTFGVFLKSKSNLLYTVHTLSSEEVKYTNSNNSIKKLLQKVEKKFLEKIAIKKANRIICLNEQLKIVLTSQFGINPSVIDVLGNGVNTKLFKSNEKREVNKLRFLYLGRLTSRKNIQTLIRAISQIDKNKYELKIAGTGEYEESLIKLVDSLDLTHNIEFVGYKSGSDLIDTYKNCDVYVLPSFYEGLPFTVLEAMASKKPVLLGNFVDADKLAIKDKTGYVVENNTEDCFANGLNYFINNKNRIAKMGEEAYIHIEKNYGLNTVLRKYETVIKEFL